MRTPSRKELLSRIQRIGDNLFDLRINEVGEEYSPYLKDKLAIHAITSSDKTTIRHKLSELEYHIKQKDAFSIKELDIIRRDIIALQEENKSLRETVGLLFDYLGVNIEKVEATPEVKVIRKVRKTRTSKA